MLGAAWKAWDAEAGSWKLESNWKVIYQTHADDWGGHSADKLGDTVVVAAGTCAPADDLCEVWFGGLGRRAGAGHAANYSRLRLPRVCLEPLELRDALFPPEKPRRGAAAGGAGADDGDDEGGEKFYEGQRVEAQWKAREKWYKRAHRAEIAATARTTSTTTTARRRVA